MWVLSQAAISAADWWPGRQQHAHALWAGGQEGVRSWEGDQHRPAIPCSNPWRHL